MLRVTDESAEAAQISPRDPGRDRVAMPDGFAFVRYHGAEKARAFRTPIPSRRPTAQTVDGVDWRAACGPNLAPENRVDIPRFDRFAALARGLA